MKRFVGPQGFIEVRATGDVMDVVFDGSPDSAALEGVFLELDRVIAERIEAPIRDHPEVDFVGWLPPARALYRQADSSAAEWARHFHFRRRLYALAATYPNFRLHDFDSVVGWTTDPWRYMDGSHFDLAMAEAIVAALGDGSREVQPGHDADIGSRAIVAAFNAVDWQGQFACDPGHPKKDMRRSRQTAPAVASVR